MVGAGVSVPDLDRVGAQTAADPSPARLTAPAAMARLAAATPALDDHELEQA